MSENVSYDFWKRCFNSYINILSWNQKPWDPFASLLTFGWLISYLNVVLLWMITYKRCGRMSSYFKVLAWNLLEKLMINIKNLVIWWSTSRCITDELKPANFFLLEYICWLWLMHLFLRFYIVTGLMSSGGWNCILSKMWFWIEMCFFWRNYFIY